MPKPFSILVPQHELDDIARRLSAYRAPNAPEDHGWDDGTSLSYLAELIAYWRDEYSWRAQEAALNRFAQFTAGVGGHQLHFVHETGRGPAPLPLVLAHGWPDGFQRFAKVIPLLTDPEAHGGDANDAFDIVVPSLPGFGYSPGGQTGQQEPNLDDYFTI